MFRRRRHDPAEPPPSTPSPSDPSPDGPRDDDLPMLSVDQSVALLGLVVTAFERHGVVVTAHFDGTVRGPDGRVFGLHNLATVVAQLPFADWPRAVDAHVGPLLAPDDAADATPDRWLLKLRPLADLPVPPDFDAAGPLPDIAVLPALDMPTQVHELMAAERVRAYAEPDVFRTRALANLRALPAPETTTLRGDDARSDSDVHVFVTDDFFGAARVLVLDHLLATALRVERPPHGVLVAVPNRHLLAVHLVTGPGVVSALELLVRLAESEHATRPGPVSDDVFHLPGGGRPGQRLTERDADTVRVVVDGRFGDVLAALGLTG